MPTTRLLLALSVSLVACAVDGRGDRSITDELPTAQGGDPDPTPVTPIEATTDCDTAAGYTLDEHVTDSGELHIVGIYEARNSDEPWWADPKCSACLDTPDSSTCIDTACDREPKPHAGSIRYGIGGSGTLVLASYEPTNWTVTVDPGAHLDRVILSSYGSASTAIVPAGVIVESVELGLAYEWMTPEERAQTCVEAHPEPMYCDGFGPFFDEDQQMRAAAIDSLVANAEAHTGKTLRSFHGCYAMSSVQLASDDAITARAGR